MKKRPNTKPLVPSDHFLSRKSRAGQWSPVCRKEFAPQTLELSPGRHIEIGFDGKDRMFHASILIDGQLRDYRDTSKLRLLDRIFSDIDRATTAATRNHETKADVLL